MEFDILFPTKENASGRKGLKRKLSDGILDDGKWMTFGPGVFLATLSGILATLAGSLMICQGCSNSDQDDCDHYSQGNIPRNSTNEEYL